MKRPIGSQTKARLKQEEQEFRLLFIVSFVLFLTAALLSRLAPWRWLSPETRGGLSIIGEAKAAANASLPFAFMG